MPFPTSSDTTVNPDSPRVWAVTVTTTSSRAINQSFVRKNLIFHNPGSVDVYVAPSHDATGVPFIPTVGGAGTIHIYAGSDWRVDSPGGASWNCIASAPAVLTVIEFS